MKIKDLLWNPLTKCRLVFKHVEQWQVQREHWLVFIIKHLQMCFTDLCMLSSLNSILSLSQFPILSPLKIMLAIEVIIIDFKIIILVPWSKSVKQTVTSLSFLTKLYIVASMQKSYSTFSPKFVVIPNLASTILKCSKK